MNLANLGETYHLLGRFGTAYDHVSRALVLHREIGDRGAEAESLRVLAGIWMDQGEHVRALDRAVEAVALATDTGHLPVQTNALNTLGGIRLRLGQAEEARAGHERALRLTRDANTGYAEVVALSGLAAWRCTGPPATATARRARPCCSATPSTPPAPTACSGRHLESGLSR